MLQGNERKNAPAWTGAVLWLALTGCAHGHTQQGKLATEAASPALAAELASLRAQLTQRDALVTQLESRLSLLEAEQRQMRYALSSQRAAELGVRETVRIPAEQSAEPARERVAQRSEPRPMLRLYEDRKPRSTEPLEPIPVTAERLPVAPLPELSASRAERVVDPYVAALDLLRKRDFPGALTELDAFLSESPSDPRAGKAQFWRGEALFAQKRYDRALKAFEASFAREPQGDKAADALLKIGLCHKRLGEPERARAAMNQLKSKFPGSEAARLAQAEEA